MPESREPYAGRQLRNARRIGAFTAGEMTRPIGTIKKETRTLGLDTCDPGLTIGVIVRGGTYVDGIISFPSSGNDASRMVADRKSTRLNSSHSQISYAVFCLKT